MTVIISTQANLKCVNSCDLRPGLPNVEVYNVKDIEQISHQNETIEFFFYLDLSVNSPNFTKEISHYIQCIVRKITFMIAENTLFYTILA